MKLKLPQIPWRNLPLPSALRHWKFSHQPLVVAYWDRTAVHYFVLCQKGNAIKALSAGSVTRSTEIEPLVQLATQLESQKLDCRQVVLLLSRSELELSTLSLPPASADEIPALVATEVEQQFGDSSAPPLVDFLLTQGSSDTTVEVLAFSLSAELLDRWRDALRPTRLRLAAISSRQLAPMGILRRRGDLRVPLSVAISIYSGEVELTLYRRDIPLFLRTLRVSSDDPRALAEQIVLEIQRCVALTSGLDRVGAPEILVFGRDDEHRALIEALQEHPLGSLKVVHPLHDWPDQRQIDDVITVVAPVSVPLEVITDSAAGEPLAAADVSAKQNTAIQSSRVDVALSGAAWDYLHGSLEIDLLAPRRPPTPPHPLRRWAVIGAAAAALLLGAIYILAAELKELRAELSERESRLVDRQRVANKVLEKADEARFVEEWLSDQVDWLNELQTISRRLPDARHATIRRLTASVSENREVIDLAVQVSDPERLAELESGLRAVDYSVTSRRVSQQALSDEYPWQFETRATYTITAVDSLRYRRPDKSAASADPGPVESESVVSEPDP